MRNLWADLFRYIVIFGGLYLFSLHKKIYYFACIKIYCMRQKQYKVTTMIFILLKKTKKSAVAIVVM